MLKTSLFDQLIECLSLDLSSVTHSSSAGRQFAIDQLLPGLRKRYIGSTNRTILSESERDLTAKAAFLDQNSWCKHINENLSMRIANCYLTNLVCNEAKLELERFFNDGSELIFDDIKMGLSLNVGPGAVTGVNSDNSFYAKVASSNATSTSKSVTAYHNRLIRMNPLSYATEKYRKLNWGRQDINDAIPELITVPKNVEKNRVILKQPSRNMELQLAIHSIVSDRALRIGWFDLESQQSINRNFAYLGSRQTEHGEARTWKFCTLDLSSASDFPFMVARHLLPEVVYDLTRFTTTPWITVDGDVKPLHMYSTMGTGFTFVMMTVILSAIVRVLYSLHGLPLKDKLRNSMTPYKSANTYAVYGDDIIVDQSVYSDLLKVLDVLGFRVNVEKSFSDGLFRESCGADFYDGYPVRPVYCQKLATKQDCASLYNRLARWAALHSVRLDRGLLLLARRYKHHRVPNYEDDTAGIHVPIEHAPNLSAVLRKKLAVNHGSMIYTCDVPKARKKALLRRKFFALQWTWIHNRFEEKHRIVVDESPVPGVNPFGYLHALLGGYVRNGRYSVRSNDVVYDTEIRVCPGWGDPSICIEGYPVIGSSGPTYNHWKRFVVLDE